MESIASVAALGSIAIWLGTLFALVMVGLVVWYLFNSSPADAEDAEMTSTAETHGA